MAKWPYSTRQWQRLRLAKLADQPLCEVCEKHGCSVVASHVDHRVAMRHGGPAFPALDGLMSMCASCHSIKTAALDNPHAFGDGRKLAFKGCDVDGNPIDATHPFNDEPTGGASDHDNGEVRTDGGSHVKSYLEIW